MYKIIGERGNGKTIKMLDFAAQNGFKVMTSNPEHLRQTAIKIGYDPGMVISSNDSDLATVCKHNNFVVDGLDEVFTQMFGNNFKGYTMTID